MKKLRDLYPSIVWRYFEEICQIPRPSKKEEKIRAYIIDFAKSHKLEYLEDEIGNINIKKPATKGMENSKAVVLQSHMDMVGEKNTDKDHDFNTDPIEAVVDGKVVRANGTTLGADDGIGIAAQLAILASNDIAHGPIECLFTVDEETGLTGAFGLKSDFLEGRILINLDSEDWGEIFIGCAGGRDTKAEFNLSMIDVPANHSAWKLAVVGLKGGHSGDEIHKGHGNSIKLLNRVLLKLTNELNMRLAWIDGGNMRNAIPREAFATVVVPKEKESELQKIVKEEEQNFRNELVVTAPDLKLQCESTPIPGQVLETDLQMKLIQSIYACPHGELAWSQTLDNLVETSTNLATIKMDDEKIEVGTSQRSSVASKLNDVVIMVQSVFKLAGANVNSSDGYPGWEPNVNSEILDIAVKSYKKLFNQDPDVKAIHAGLECGLIGEKYPGIDMVSIGPDIKGAHTPKEYIDIKTTEEFWELLLDILKNIPG